MEIENHPSRFYFSTVCFQSFLLMNGIVVLSNNVSS